MCASPAQINETSKLCVYGLSVFLNFHVENVIFSVAVWRDGAFKR